jgi:hypothetical protein
MISLAEALETIQREESQLAEHRLPLDRLIVEPAAVRAGDGRYRITPEGLERVCDRIAHRPKIPAQYVASLPERLRAEVFRHHLSEAGEGGRMVSLFTRGEDLVGLGRADLARLGGADVLEAVAEGLGGDGDHLQVTRLESRNESVLCDVITHRAERQVRRGDVVFGGIHIDHSMTGDYATRVEGYLYRLACTNGAIHRECLDKGRPARTRRLPVDHPHAHLQQREQVKRLAADALNALSSRLQALERLTTERVDLPHLAANWLRRARLSPDRLLPLLRRAYAEEGGEGTAYDVMNAFTRVATHETELSPRTRETLARLGGMLAFGHSRLCNRCWSVIAAGN